MKVLQNQGKTELELEVPAFAWDAAGAFWVIGRLERHEVLRANQLPPEAWVLTEPLGVRVRIDGFGLLAVVLKALRSRSGKAKGGPVRVEITPAKWRRREP